jgi:hypothetical protein
MKLMELSKEWEGSRRGLHGGVILAHKLQNSEQIHEHLWQDSH